MKVAIIAGATGLIGKQLLQLLLDDPEYHSVTSVVRSPADISHPKLKQIVVDFDQLEEYSNQLKGDVVFCCLGTTMKKAKSKEAFRKVDFHYPVELAKVTRAQGAQQFLIVSALGADKNSSIFYNKVKGETEEAVGGVGFQSYHIFRPSLLLGPRSEQRAGEDAAKAFYKFFAFLIPAKYKAIESIKVAKAMQFYARSEDEGRNIHESKSMQRF